MHVATAAFSKITNGVKNAATRTAHLDKKQLIQGAMAVSLAIGTLTPLIFASSPLAIPVANIALMTFSGLLVVTILK